MKRDKRCWGCDFDQDGIAEKFRELNCNNCKENNYAGYVMSHGERLILELHKRLRIVELRKKEFEAGITFEDYSWKCPYCDRAFEIGIPKSYPNDIKIFCPYCKEKLR